jgi:hypothetical protein
MVELGQPAHALRAQPLDVAGVADRADPAPHRGQRPIELGGDPPVAGPTALASRADPMTAVVSARRTVTAADSSTWVMRQVRQRARRGRNVSVVGPWSRTVRVRACPHGRSGRPHRGQGSAPAARAVSAWPGSAIPIIATRWGHGARSWSTSRISGRGQLVWQPVRGAGSTRGARPTGTGSARCRRPVPAGCALGWDGLVRRHGGDADEPLVHPMFVVTVDGVKTADRSSSREAVNTHLWLPDGTGALGLEP